MKSVFGIVLAALSLFGLVHQNTVVKPPQVAVKLSSAKWHSSGQTASAAVFNSVAATSPPVPSPTVVHVNTTTEASTLLSVNTATVVTASGVTPAPVANLAGYVTQQALSQQLTDLSASMRQLIYNQNAESTSSLYASLWGAIALSQRIDSLPSTVTVGGSTIVTQASLPALSGLSGLLGISQGGTGITAVPTYGQILVGDGNGNYTLVATSSLGLAGAGSNPWAFSGSNISYMSGNVGIGTTTASALLAIDSTSTTGTIIRISNGSSGGHVYDFLETGSGNTGGAGRLDFFDRTANVARLSIAANGNIGIGTTSPFTNFAVNGNGFFSGALSLGLALSPSNGGTGTSTTPTANRLLLSDANGNWEYISTSSLGVVSGVSSVSNADGTLTITPTSGNVVASLNLANINTWTGTQTFGGLIATNATTSNLIAQQATTSRLAISSIASALLETNASGSVVPAIAGTDYLNTAVTSIGPMGQLQSGAAQTLATSTSSLNGLTAGLTIVASGNTQIFTPALSGVLSYQGGGTGIATPTAAGVILGNYAGTGYQQLATSSLGLLTSNVGEGSNLYFTNARAQAALAVAGLPLTYSAGVIGINQATLSQNGYLSSTDFTTFENKISSTSLSAAAPLTYNPTSGAFSIAQVGASSNGYLASSDWTTFNGKLGSSTVASLSPNYDAMWNGSAFTNGAIYDNGTSIGVGTTSTAALLTVDSTSTTGTILRISNGDVGGHVFDFLSTGSANTSGAGRLDIFDKTSNLPRLSIAANGSLGIGTTTPDATLTVQGNSHTTGASLLDGAGTYLMSTFSSDSNASLYLLTSSDGINFTFLQSSAVYTGSGTVRDPSIMEYANQFCVAYTSGSSSSFGITCSRDLKNWTLLTNVSMSAISGVSQVYAPEWYVDTDGSIHVLVAVSADGGTTFQIYEIHSTTGNKNSTSPSIYDLTNWSAPVKLTGTSFSSIKMIDPFIVKRGGTYYLWFADTGSGYIDYASSASLTSGYTIQQSGNWASWGQAEGPSILQLPDGTWRIYMDLLPSNGGHGIVYSNSSDGLTSWSATTDISPFNVRHGTIIRTTNQNTSRQIQNMLLPAIPSLWNVSGKWTATGDSVTALLPDANHSLTATWAGNYQWKSTDPVLWDTGRFEVRATSTDSGITSGQLDVDATNHAIYIGRVSNTSGSTDNAIFRDRGGNVIFTVLMSTGATGVGSGNSSPADTLDVYNAKASTGITREQVREGAGQSTNEVFGIYANNGTTPRLVVQNGSVGIGTTTPYSRLTIWGSDTASSTPAFSIVNSASTTEFQIFDGGNAQLAGTLTQNSDQRLKTNITSLDASTSLAAINALTPVTYNWLDPAKSGDRQYGFIAQQVQQVFPELVSTTSATALTPDGTLGLNYLGLIAPIVEAVQTLSTEVTSLEASVAGFANSFTTKQLCVEKSDGTPVCITGDQLSNILSGTSQVNISVPTPPVISGTNTPPSINIQGNNPATIDVGSTYTDLGAIATDNQGNNLGYKTFLNGTLVSNVIIDTSTVATDTIDYVATDTWGNTSTSTRTVIVEAASTSTAQ